MCRWLEIVADGDGAYPGVLVTAGDAELRGGGPQRGRTKRMLIPKPLILKYCSDTLTSLLANCSHIKEYFADILLA